MGISGKELNEQTPAGEPPITAGSLRGSFQFREAESIALYSACRTTVLFRNAAVGEKSWIHQNS
jgi:hypothetical protein